MSRVIVQRRLNAAAAAGLPGSMTPLLRRIYAARDIAQPSELDYSLQQLLSPDRLDGLDRAAELLAGVIRAHGRILVIGDFDADGATSCALCMRGLRALGATDVGYLVPNRFEFGYGLTPEIVAVARQREPDLIMTVDNGIASLSGAAAARAAGIRLLITDHHLPGNELPVADAVVNPNLPSSAFPSRALAGVGVAFYVLLALRARLRASGWFGTADRPEPNLARWLDLVALGTVADVVALDHNNRILVQQGLARIRAGQCVPGISALLETGNRQPGSVVAADLGFAVGPRLNAAGRLDDMSLGIECLLADDEDQARAMARQLDALNRDRRAIEADMQAEALALVERLQLGADLPLGLCLFEPDWHQGVIGILAARIRERVHRPVIAFARAGDGLLRGSARSVEGLHIRDVLDAVATRHPQLLHRFGGHAMAAGLSLAEQDLPQFAAAFDAEVSRYLDRDDLYSCVYSDGELQDDELSLETALQLRAAGPWGQGFPEPVFDGRFEILAQRVVGNEHLRLTVRPQYGSRTIEAIAFNTGQLPAACRTAHLAYRLAVNEFRGQVMPQLVVEHLEY